MYTNEWGGRAVAVLALAAAAILAGLILSLAGAIVVSPDALDALSVGTAATALIVVILAYGGAPTGVWTHAGRALVLAGMTLVLAGDAFQDVALRSNAGDARLLWSISFAIRDGIGNGLFYASLLVLGGLLWSRHRAIAGIAVANGVLGFLDMAFAARLGLPPHVNFILLVVWFVGLAAIWWRNGTTSQVAGHEVTAGAAS